MHLPVHASLSPSGSSRRRLLGTLAGASAALALAACSPASGQAPLDDVGMADGEKLTLTPETLARKARGFDVGQAMSRRRVFVFFDPQCPHCSRLWTFLEPLAAQARFTWIPLGFMNPASIAQSAAILASESPAKTMQEHEVAFAGAGYRGGMSAPRPSAQTRAPVEANTKLFERLGLMSVPVIVSRHESSGEVYVHNGALPGAQLAQALGWQA